jgi:hypothetical protein
MELLLRSLSCAFELACWPASEQPVSTVSSILARVFFARMVWNKIAVGTPIKATWLCLSLQDRRDAIELQEQGFVQTEMVSAALS